MKRAIFIAPHHDDEILGCGGTILRKKLNSDGTVDHELTTPGNWSAAKEIKGQASDTGTADTRNLWTAMPGKTYIGNWNNFHPDFMSSIKSLMDELGYEVPDYHHASSSCASVGVNGNDDDIEVLTYLHYINKITQFYYLKKYKNTNKYNQSPPKKCQKVTASSKPKFSFKYLFLRLFIITTLNTTNPANK